jgi:hypothetical protein
MPPCTGCAIEVAEDTLVCPSCRTPTHIGRKKSLRIGAALVLAPALFYFLWVGILGADFLAKKARHLGIDDRLVYMECCLAGAIVEFAALWFLNRVLRRPFNLLTVCAALLAMVSIPFVIFLFVEIILIGLSGWN